MSVRGRFARLGALTLGALALVALGSAARADVWTMEVHTGEQTKRFTVSSVDSVTFHEIELPVEMVLIPAGSFTMGDGAAACGTDEREVALTRGFWLGRYEVTNQEYLEAVQWAHDNGKVAASPVSVKDLLDGSTEELLDLDDLECEIAFSGGTFTLRDAGHGLNPDHPVKELTWYGAAAFCDWLSERAGLPRAYDHSTWECNGGDPYGALGYRLPTDAEWEFAAQFDDERIYPWGDAPPDSTLLNYSSSVGWTTPVGSYPGTPAGAELVYDLAGNVFEFCNDRNVCFLGTANEIDPTGPETGTFRVMRGGSFTSDTVRCSDRLAVFPSSADVNYGFRIARSE